MTKKTKRHTHDQLIRILATPEQKAEIENAAVAANKSASRFCLDAALAMIKAQQQ